MRIPPDNPFHILNTTVTIRNLGSSRYLIGDWQDSLQLKIVNHTLYLVGEPALIPTVVFANFREDPTYVKVKRIYLW